MSIHIRCPQGHLVELGESKIGRDVVCPACLAVFPGADRFETAQHARAGKGKSRRASDDDDDDDEDDEEDDDEDERPKKKTKPAKSKKKVQDDDDDDDDDDEEEEKPKKKAPPAKAKKKVQKDDEDEDEEDDEDEDEEDEDEEDGEPEEEEEPIEWTARKRQLNICSHGLMVFMVALYILCFFTLFASVSVDCYEMFDNWKAPVPEGGWRVEGLTWGLFYGIAVPLLYLATVVLMGGLVVSFAVPAKAEARTPIIGGLVFGGLVFFLGILLILSLTGTIVTNATVEKNMTNLLVGGSLLCFALCLQCTMAYQSRLFVFLKMHLESTQPITNGAFVLLVYAGMIIIVVFLSYPLKDNLGGWVGYIISALIDGIAGFAIYLLISHAILIQSLRKRIQAYIKDE